MVSGISGERFLQLSGMCDLLACVEPWGDGVFPLLYISMRDVGADAPISHREHPIYFLTFLAKAARLVSITSSGLVSFSFPCQRVAVASLDQMNVVQDLGVHVQSCYHFCFTAVEPVFLIR